MVTHIRTVKLFSGKPLHTTQIELTNQLRQKCMTKQASNEEYEEKQNIVSPFLTYHNKFAETTLEIPFAKAIVNSSSSLKPHSWRLKKVG